MVGLFVVMGITPSKGQDRDAAQLNYDSLSQQNTNDLIITGDSLSLAADSVAQEQIGDIETTIQYSAEDSIQMDVANQIVEGNGSIVGLMVESNIGEGNQPISDSLAYGVSVTDACINWETTAEAIHSL